MNLFLPLRVRGTRAVFAALSLAAAAEAAAQGSLTPPGAPAPSMKSLADLDAKLDARTEPRIAIETLAGDASGLYVINTPGSYYLRGNLSVANPTLAAIRVTAPNVTVDLNGFTVTGAGRGVANAAGIQLFQPGTRVVNGVITGFQDGVYSNAATTVENVRVREVTLSGLNLDLNSSRAVGCSVFGAGSGGIQAGLIDDCIVNGIGDPGVAGDATGMIANVVTRSTVLNVQPSFAPGVAFGIKAHHATGCHVGYLGSPTQSYAYILRTIGVGSAQDCSAASISANTQAFGFYVQVARGCSVQQLSSSSSFVTGFEVSVAESCSVDNLSGAASITTGIKAGVARGCHVNNVGGSAGTFYGIDGAVISQCSVVNLQPAAGTAIGINVGTTGMAESNRVYSVRNFGIRGTSGGTVRNNTIGAVGLVAGVTDGACIHVNGVDNRIEGNTMQGGTNADYGLRIIVNSRNLVAGNRATGTFTGPATGAILDTPEFNIVAGNRFGPIVSAFAATGEITATNPFSNFSD